MAASTPDLLLQSMGQREGMRSFTVEMEEAAALPLEDDEASSAVPHTSLRSVHHQPKKTLVNNNNNNGLNIKKSSSNVCNVVDDNGVAAEASPAVASNVSVGSSLASPGASITMDNRTQRPQGGRGVKVNGGSSSSRRTTGAASAGGPTSLRLLTCQRDTPADQRAAEVVASRDITFHPMIVCPLQNLGNTCYFNSGVQLLANCPAFVYGVRNAPFFQPTRTNSPLQSNMKLVNRSNATSKLCLRGGDSTHALFEEFAGLLSRMENNNLGSGEALSPLRALDALARVHTQFEGRSQQDAAEMMTALLASLEEEGGQYAEVDQLLTSFAEDAVPWSNQQNTASSSSPRPTTGDNSNSGGCGNNTRSHSEPYCSEEFSSASPASFTKPDNTKVMPGARSAHEMAMLRFMKQVNAENEQLERRVKQRQGKPYLGTFRPPRLHYNPVMDGFRGYAVSQVECHHCRNVSRVVSDYNAILLDIPTSRQRSQFAANHPNLRRLAPDGQPLHTKKRAAFTWWNPLTFFTSAWNHLTRLFTRSVPFPLTLQECLDIHFEPVKLQGPNRYHCDSCGTTSEATKSETLLGLPEYLVLHMKRFGAGRCFNSKKTDPVIFPVSWAPLSPADAAKPQLPMAAMPEILDMRRYLHSVSAPFAEPIPPCLKRSLGAVEEAQQSPQRLSKSPPPLNNGGNSGDNEVHGCSNDKICKKNMSSLSGAEAETTTSSTPTPLPVLTVNADGSTPGAIPTTYTLDGIVNHHGGYDGGHYTVYLYKATTERQMWVCISDDEIKWASAGDAADSEEYVLLYRRQAIVQPPVESNEGEQLRQKACFYLSREPDGNGNSNSAEAPETASPVTKSTAGGVASAKSPSLSSPPSASASPYVYISRMWLQRVAFLREPGPIVNRLCYCAPDERKKVVSHRGLFPADVQVPEEVPHVHGPPVDWFYVPITRTDYAIFHDAFGGNAAVSAADVEAIRQLQERFVTNVTTAEQAKGRAVR